MSVSYTHLDVYKRQDLTSGLVFQKHSANGLIHCDNENIKRKRPVRQKIQLSNTMRPD